MKLKLKDWNLSAGRPIAFIHEANAKKISAHIGDRIELRYKGKKIIAVTDIVNNFLKPDEISISTEVKEYLRTDSKSLIDVNLALEPISNYYIKKKLDGYVLSKEEIHTIIEDIVNNALTEAEIAYFVSGVYEKGMNLQETIALTDSIVKTGETLKWHSRFTADKHCIGGIPGNRTTPIVVSICAAAGIIMPKTSSRAITSAAGTADSVEIMTNVDFPASELKKIVEKTGACLAWGGALGLAPADDKLIRVERLLNIDPESQLIASILAKKIAAGSTHILIDIPCGPGAKVSKKEALELKSKFLKVGKHFNLKLLIVLTDGSQPIGNGIGATLEIQDVLKVLKRQNSPKDLEEKSIFLAGKILEMTNKCQKGKGVKKALEILDSGKALAKFEEIITAQGKKSKIVCAPFKYDIHSKSNGKVVSIKNNLINNTARILGCPVDKCAGIYLYRHVGDSVKKSDLVLTLYSESSKKLQEAVDFFEKSVPIIIS